MLLFVLDSNSYYDMFKNNAYNFTMFAAEKAKDLKEKSKTVINNIQNKYGGSN